jgi:hypothetical protein
MAVKKAVKKDTTPEVEVQETPVVETEVTEEVSVDTEVEDKTEEVETDVEVSVPEEEKEPEVEIDSKAVEDKTVVHKNVRVRANRDHRCFIGGELYDLKEGQCYNVPEFVKKTLNRAGVLAPL